MKDNDEYEGALALNRDQYAYLKELVTVEAEFQKQLLNKYAPLEGNLKADIIKARQAEEYYNQAKFMLNILARYKTFAELRNLRHAKA